MFKNKHILVAMLVTPILAIFAWFATDMIVGETPFEPVGGETYKLVEKPNCRWPSGQCSLKNGNFELTMKAKHVADGLMEIQLNSTHPVVGIQLGLFEPDSDNESGEAPVNMQSDDAAGFKWWMHLTQPTSEASRLRLAVKADNSFYFGEVGVLFMQENDAELPPSRDS